MPRAPGGPRLCGRARHVARHARPRRRASAQAEELGRCLAGGQQPGQARAGLSDAPEGHARSAAKGSCGARGAPRGACGPALRAARLARGRQGRPSSSHRLASAASLACRGRGRRGAAAAGSCCCQARRGRALVPVLGLAPPPRCSGAVQHFEVASAAPEERQGLGAEAGDGQHAPCKPEGEGHCARKFEWRTPSPCEHFLGRGG
mmetsp:Transcript_42406/g.122674  ORF Transcript_42406/g.122674 Transcript_42406/m.122674 type:complete len:205 (+) Transcript_42406:1172-1786(+)